MLVLCEFVANTKDDWLIIDYRPSSEASESSKRQAQDILGYITQVPRFDFLIMLLDDADRQTASQVVADAQIRQMWLS